MDPGPGARILPYPRYKELEVPGTKSGGPKVEITAEDDAQIRSAIEAMGGVAGERLPAGLPGSFADTPEL